MTEYIAAIDQGTTSTRCVLFDRSGTALASNQREHRQLFPRPGLVEHDALEIWEATRAAVRAAMAQERVDGLRGVGITNQRETLVIWDPTTGQPLCPAIVWQDTRSKELCDELAADGGPDRFRAKTGLPLATYFSGPKIAWALKHVEGLRAAAEKGRAICGTIDYWLVWNLSGGVDGGVHVTDVTNASRTQLMDLRKLEWDAEILAVLGIPPRMLPAIVPSSDAQRYGRTRAAGPFGAEVPIAGVLGDQHAALFGQCCFEPGEAKNTYGTGCFLVLNTGEVAVDSPSGLLTTLGYQLAGQAPVYALEGSIAVAGALVQWLRDNLGLIESSEQVEELARGVEDNGGVYFVPAFSGLFAPRWRADARGVVCGLTRFANKGHIARATLEATCYQAREVLEAMRTDSGVALAELRVDGGMTRNELLMQFQADVLDTPVVRPAYTESTVLGAAFAAGLAVGFFDDQEQLRATWRAGRRFEPQMEPRERAALIAGWDKAVERSLDWVD